MKLNKILSIILVLSMILSSVPTVFANEIESETYENEIEILNAIGVMDYIPEPEKLISRGEFAALLVKLNGISPDSLSEPNQLFHDVPVTHKYLQEISYCARMGYMSGYGNQIFNPDYKILAEEAVASIVKFLGYSYLAKSHGDGYTGYIAAAREIGLTKGISLPYGECIFYEEAAKLIYNALEIPLVTLDGISDNEKSYSTDPSVTPLTKYHKMAKISGIVTATDVTGIMGFSAADEGSFILDGHTYNTDNKSIRRYLGYEMEIIYSIDEISQDECVIFAPKYDMKKVSVPASDFVSISAGSFKYIDSEDKTLDLKLSSNFDFIYNGKLTLFDETIIENATYGYFELLSTGNSSTYDVVMFNDYLTLVVDSVVPSREMIQGDSQVQGGGTLLLNYDSSVYDYVFVDENGNIVDATSLSQNDVLTYYTNGKYIFGYVSKSSVSGTVEMKSDADMEIYIDSASYKFSGDKASFYSTINLNDNVTLYLDFLGNVAGARSSGEKTPDMYIPMKLVRKTVDGDDCVLLKAYDITAVKIIEVYLNKRVKLDGASIADSYSSYSQINNSLFSSTAGTPAILKFNDEGKVFEIDTPCLASSFAESEDGFTTMLDAESTYYYKTNQNYGQKAYGNANTKYLLIPSDLSTATEEDFIITTKPSTSATRVTYAYTDSKNNKYATLVMFNSDAYFSIAGNASSAVVTKIVDTVDEYGEKCKKFYYFVGGVENYFLSKNGDLQDSFKPASTTAYYQPPVYIKDLQPGDIISVGLDNKRYIVAFRCLWKSDTMALKSQYQNVHKYRFAQGTVKAVDSAFLTLDIDVNTSSTSYTSREYYLHSGVEVVILKGNGTNKVTMEPASLADLVVGDQVVFQALSYSLQRVYIIK